MAVRKDRFQREDMGYLLYASRQSINKQAGLGRLGYIAGWCFDLKTLSQAETSDYQYIAN